MTDKQKELFNVSKNNFSEWYETILKVADVVDKRYPVKGMPILKPNGWYMHEQIMKMVEKEWNQQNIQKVQFPVLIPESFLNKEADHIKGFSDEVFWVPFTKDDDQENTDEKKQIYRCALRPTSETAMYSVFGEWIQSYNDLPLKVHQTCAVYRYETKSTLPLIRAREIHWNEAHTCHETENDALQNLEMAWSSYRDIIENRLCVFGLRLRRPIWDQFAGSVHTDVMDALLPNGKCLQIVGAHYLGQKFSKPFEIKFLDNKGEWKYTYMTCYGVSTRLLASCLSIHGDDKGLVLPPAISKYTFVILPILFKGKDEIVNNGVKTLYEYLTSCGYYVFVDNSPKRPGEKHYYWEMKGVPMVIEVGPRDVEKNTFVVVPRIKLSNNEKIIVSFDYTPTEWDSSSFHGGTKSNDETHKELNNILTNYTELLKVESYKNHKARIYDATSLEQIKEYIAIGGFVRIPFYTKGVEGKKENDIIHAECGGEIRGFIPDETIESGIKCAMTGQPAVCYAYVAKSY